MEPYRNSWSARFVSGGISIALVGGGLVAALRLDPGVLLPVILLAAVGACIAGLVLGIHSHTGPVTALAIALPLLLWPYVLGLLWGISQAPALGWLFAGVGSVLTAMNVISPFLHEANVPVERRSAATT
jgi:hypothetical protein